MNKSRVEKLLTQAMCKDFINKIVSRGKSDHEVYFRNIDLEQDLLRTEFFIVSRTLDNSLMNKGYAFFTPYSCTILKTLDPNNRKATTYKREYAEFICEHLRSVSQKEQQISVEEYIKEYNAFHLAETNREIKKLNDAYNEIKMPESEAQSDN